MRSVPRAAAHHPTGRRRDGRWTRHPRGRPPVRASDVPLAARRHRRPVQADGAEYLAHDHDHDRTAQSPACTPAARGAHLDARTLGASPSPTAAQEHAMRINRRHKQACPKLTYQADRFAADHGDEADCARRLVADGRRRRSLDLEGVVGCVRRLRREELGNSHGSRTTSRPPNASSSLYAACLTNPRSHTDTVTRSDPAQDRAVRGSGLASAGRSRRRLLPRVQPATPSRGRGTGKPSARSAQASR